MVSSIFFPKSLPAFSSSLRAFFPSASQVYSDPRVVLPAYCRVRFSSKPQQFRCLIFHFRRWRVSDISVARRVFTDHLPTSLDR